MTDLTVQRTLVKSPPELWSELSEVEGLARHLGEFGEIRITRAAPETTVAWEGEHASGTVEIEASGWGTKVTLTAAVSGAEPETPEPEAETEPEPIRLSDELDRIADRAQESYWDDLVHWGEREGDAKPPPETRRNRFARFFRRRPRREPIEETLAAERREDAATAAAAAEPSPEENPIAVVTPEPEATKPPQSEPEPEPQPDPDTTIAPDHALAVLEHALDNLGAAHHRPFSRG